MKRLLLPVLIIIIVTAGLVYLLRDDTPASSTESGSNSIKSLPTVNVADVKNTNPTEKCLSGELSNLAISEETYKAIEMASIMHIIDVPAGTNANVDIAGYGPSEASGSIVYDGDYGSYNFKVGSEKPNSADSNDWKIIGFSACRK